MPSQFFGLQIAASGLRAANAALNTTANNISNSNTDGYSRQLVSQEANDALRVFTTYGCAGAGVDTIAIERSRDLFYDHKYWDNQTRLGEHEIKQYYMATAESYLDDDGKTGFKSVFNDMTNALQEITKNSSSTSTKANFISSLQALTDYFNNMYANFQNLQRDTNSEIQVTVDNINSIAEKIATLNKQINVIELSGARANELRDQRDLLVDELSELVKVETVETKIYDTNDPDRETGGTRYVVKIAGGEALVDANSYNQLECKAREADMTVNQTDVTGLYDLYWKGTGNKFSLSNASLGGKLKGLVDMRDGNNGTYFKGELKDVSDASYESEGKTISTKKVTVEVSDDVLTDMNKCNLSDRGGPIKLGNTYYYYKDWSYDEASKTYTFTLNGEKDSDFSGLSGGVFAAVGDNIEYQGIPYYLSQMNEWVRGFSDAVNEIIMSGFDANRNPATFLLTGDKTTEDAQYDITDLKDADGYYQLTAGNFSVNEALIANADLLGTRSATDESVPESTYGVEECETIKSLIKAMNDKTIYNFRNSTAGEFLTNILSDAALNASNANTFCTTYEGLQSTIQNQRLTVFGVDEDEEASNLVQFQNAYTLSSKMIQTLTEIYNRLILETGV